MKNIIKNTAKIIGGIAIGVALLAIPFLASKTSQAQAPGNIYSVGGASSRIIATNMATGVISTNNTLITINTASSLAVQLNLLALGAGNTNTVSVLLQSSVDQTNWVALSTLSLTGLGSTNATCISNLTVNAQPYVRVRTITSTANSVGTNANTEVWAAQKYGL